MVGMGGKAADRVDLGSDGDGLAENGHFSGSIDQAASQCSECLKAGDHHSAFTARQVFAQLVFDPAGFAHAAGRDDDRAAFDVVERT